MVTDDSLNVLERMDSYFASLNLSAKTKNNYKRSLNSDFVRDIIGNLYRQASIFSITDLDSLWNIYSIINSHPVNISKHRVYSASVMSYVKFLNKGKKVGKRVDFNKPRPIKL